MTGMEMMLKSFGLDPTELRNMLTGAKDQIEARVVAVETSVKVLGVMLEVMMTPEQREQALQLVKERITNPDPATQQTALPQPAQKG